MFSIKFKTIGEPNLGIPIVTARGIKSDVVKLIRIHHINHIIFFISRYFVIKMFVFYLELFDRLYVTLHLMLYSGKSLHDYYFWYNYFNIFERILQ